MTDTPPPPDASREPPPEAGPPPPPPTEPPPPPSPPEPPTAPTAPAAVEPPPKTGAARGVALMLAVAAVVAAGIAARSSLLASQATGHWQTAVREEIKSGVAMIEDVRFLYQDEASQAFTIVAARVRAEELRERAARARPEVRALLLIEASAQEQLADAVTPASEIASDHDRYATEDGGYDLGKRLADNRNRFPDLVAIDPEVAQARADERADEAVLMLAAATPVGIAFLFGALAQGYPRRRRTFLGVGWTALVVALVAAVLVEVLV